MTFCRVEHAAAGIQGGGSRVVVEDSLFSNSQAGAALFEGLDARFLRCEFRDNDTGVLLRLNRSSHLEKCRIVNNRKMGVLSTSSSVCLIDSFVTDNGAVGIECSKGSSGRLVGNRVEHHERGLVISWMSDTEVRDNCLRGNRVGVWAEKHVSPLVTGNEISGNEIGVYCNWAARPRLQYNDIVRNSRFAVVLGDNLSAPAEQVLPPRGPAARDRFRKATQRAVDRPISPSAVLAEGLVDARDNWWGDDPIAEMTTKGPDGNITVFEDGWDKPTVEYAGPQGEKTGQRFPRDKVAFSPWSKGPFRR